MTEVGGLRGFVNPWYFSAHPKCQSISCCLFSRNKESLRSSVANHHLELIYPANDVPHLSR